MLEHEAIECEPIASSETLDALEKGLERLGKFDGYIRDQRKSSRTRTSDNFWFSVSKTNFMRKKLANVDLAIKEYQDTLHQFKQARKALQAMSRSLEIRMGEFKSKMHHVVLSRGIAKAPDEVLAQIFQHVLLPSDTENDTFGTRPAVLQMVCRRFANIVIRYPGLWSYLSSSMKIDEVVLRLRRSGTTCLRVHMDFRKPGISAFVDAVVEHSHRWHEVHLDFDDIDIPHTNSRTSKRYVKMLELDTPLLESVVARLQDRDDYLASGGFYTTWKAPRLVRLSCKQTIPPPLCENMKEFDFWVSNEGIQQEDRWCLYQFYSSAAEWSSLTTLRLNIHHPDFEDCLDSVIPSVSFPNLVSLQMRLCLVSLLYRDEYIEDEERATIVFGNALYEFIVKLDTLLLQELLIVIDNDDSWTPHTHEFFRQLALAYQDSTTLRRFELTHKVTPLRIDESVLNPMFSHLKFDGSVTLGGMSFTDGATRELSALLSQQETRPLRRVHLKDCLLSDAVIQGFLEAFSDESIYPDFKAFILTRCSGFTRDNLIGMAGFEYVVYWDD